VILLPAFLFYARSVSSELESNQIVAFQHAPEAAQIAKVTRVCQGHVHRARHVMSHGIDYLNTGTWSPAYRDVECLQPYGRKCFAWIRHAARPEGGESKASERIAQLYEWVVGKGPVLIQREPPPAP
jgi:hypothetical protein